MNKDYLEDAEREIRKWEEIKPGYLARVGSLVLWPAQKSAELLIPAGVQEKVGQALFSCLSGLSAAAEWTTDDAKVARKVAKIRKKYDDPLQAADAAARTYWRWGVLSAVAEGASTGWPGWPGLIADIPGLFFIVFRCIHQIGQAYGYDTSKDYEREYIMHILRTGSTAELKAKAEFLVALKQVEQVLRKVTWKKMNEALACKEISRLSLLAAMRQFAKSLGIQLTKRKALQMVPLVGALVGGAFNGTFVNDIARAAYMSYRRRYIEEVEGKVDECDREAQPV